MTIGKICNHRVVTINEDLTIKEAADVMAKQNVGFLVVIKENGSSLPVGSLTDRDIIVNAIVKGLDIENTKVSQVMVKDVIAADETLGVYETIKMMSINKVRRLPVVSGDNQVIGIVTLDDLLIMLANEISTLAEVPQQQIIK